MTSYFDVFMEENLVTFEKLPLIAKALMFYNTLPSSAPTFTIFFPTFNLITILGTHLYCLQGFKLIFKEMTNLLYYYWISLHT